MHFSQRVLPRTLSKLALVPLLFSTSVAMAGWTLSPESTLTFQSTKNTHKVETHHFSNITGTIKDNGSSTVIVDLASVQTGIPIRDERAQKHLFETEKFATAAMQSSVPVSVIKQLNAGKTQRFNLSGSLILHGQRIAIKTPVLAVPAKDNSIVVSSLTPLILNADQFELTGGIETLREIAKLATIGHKVPVNFTLIFKPE